MLEFMKMLKIHFSNHYLKFLKFYFKIKLKFIKGFIKVTKFVSESTYKEEEDKVNVDYSDLHKKTKNYVEGIMENVTIKI